MLSPDPLRPGTSLYKKREAVCPKVVDGPFRRFKWLAMAITLAIYYATPWLRWNRGPYAPHQAVLIDLAHRRFYLFSIEIWPQEFYFVAGLLIMAGIGLFLLTSAVGRAWCGFACPQTVWTDLYQHVDRLIDGDRNAQLKLDAAPWSAHKLFKRLLKWSTYLVIAFWTGGAWIMYFADAPTLVRDFWSGNAAPVAYATVGVLTFTTFALGGFMREQVCIYMCPWPRIQTAMLDEQSLIVTYKDWRGEPRGSVKAAQKAPGTIGDCVDCNQCVAVCPTGYDIRGGPDIACITCGLCIDACDKVMEQVGRPKGLIAYATLEDCAAERAGGADKPLLKTLLRPRTLLYLGVWGAIGMGLLFTLGNRVRLDLAVQKDRNPPFMLLSNGEIRNAYTLKLRNMESRPRVFEVAMSGLTRGVMWSDDSSRAAARRVLTFPVAPDLVLPVRLYVAAPPGTRGEKFAFTLTARDAEGGHDASTVRFDAPDDSDLASGGDH